MIKKLPEEVISKISAGEVIENPASCVRELIENSLDAGASLVKIKIEGGGIDLIEVEDDGAGIPPDEIQIAVQRFTTSKIKSLEDLKSINSLGFRGEALYAISQVSYLMIKSSISGVEEGWECEFEAGALKGCRPSPCAKGTTVIVKDLFFNFPVRRKFLLSKREESRRVLSEVISYAVWHDNVHFEFWEDGVKKLSLPKGDFAERLISILGNEIIERSAFVKYKDDYIDIMAFLEKPEFVDSKANEQIVLINGRKVRGDQIRKIIYKVYEKPQGQPDFVVRINVRPEFVDFNVHPQKRDVKIAPYVRLTEKLFKVFSERLREHLYEIYPQESRLQNQSLGILEVNKNSPSIKQLEFGEMAKAETRNESATELQPLNVWQSHDSFVYVETKSGVMIIDQHAAHERIIFDKLKRKEFALQSLMFPIVVELSAKEKDLLEKYSEFFNNHYFEVRFLGGNTLVVDKVPSVFKNVTKDDIKDLISSLEDVASLPDRLESFLKTIACKSAVKFGDKLSHDDIARLVDELFATETPFYCPHGRPTIYFISLEELKSKFER